MNRVRVPLSLIAFALLFASVGLKAVLVRSDVAIDHQRVAYDLARLYASRGADAEVKRGTLGEYAMFEKGACRAAIRSISPGLAIDALIDRDLAAYPRVRFVYRNAFTNIEPKAYPLATFQGARIANRIGVEARWQPVFLEADNGKCVDKDVVPSGVKATFVPLG